MFLTLVKKQLLELFSGYVIDRKTGKARSKGGITASIVLMIAVFGFLGFAFFSIAAGVGGSFLGHGINWLYFAITALLSFALGVFGSVFNTFSSLYLPKDNEFLLSLPIPSRTIILARVAGVYITSLMYSAIVWIPAMIAYWLIVPVSAANIVFPILLTFVIALFVSVLSCILGWVVALIASKTKGKSFLTVILTLVFLGVYYFIYFKVMNSLEDIITRLDSIGTIVSSRLHYVWLIGMAADGDALSMLAVVGITVALAAVCVFVLSKTFTRLALSAEKGGTGSKKVIGYEKRTLRKALLFREFKHFTSLSTWMLNGALGLLMMIVVAVAAIVKAGTIREALFAGGENAMPNEILSVFPVVILAVIALLVSTNSLLSSSISLEGKTLWILETLPVSPREIIRAKERMGVLLNIFPVLFTTVVLGIVFMLDVPQILLLVLAECLYVLLTQDFGLFLNLLRPDFSWANPTVVIKQSLPVFINLFGEWLFCAAIGFGGFFLASVAGVYVAMLAIAALFAVLYALIHYWLRTKGEKIFAEL